MSRARKNQDRGRTASLNSNGATLLQILQKVRISSTLLQSIAMTKLMNKFFSQDPKRYLSQSPLVSEYDLCPDGENLTNGGFYL